MTMELFENWHAHLTTSYTRNGEVISCGLLACAFAKTLQDSGKQWDIKCLHNADMNKSLHPKPYSLSWGGHVVVVSDNIVFDPILPKPLPFTEYCNTLFPNQEIRIRSMNRFSFPDQS